MSGQFGLFLLATLLLSLSPGPNVFLLVSLGLRDGAAAVLRASAGIAAASAVFLLVSALGLIALLTAYAPLFQALCIAGAAYLMWLGFGMLWGIRAAVAAGEGKLGQAAAPFVQGFVTHIANPKAVLYWSALLPQFLDARRSPAAQVMLLGSSGIALDVVVLCGYGLVASAARRGSLSAGMQRTVNFTGGLFFVAVGVLLLLNAARQSP